MPENVYAKINDEITIAEGPTREGYAFKGWCDDKEGKENCYEVGKKYHFDKAGTLTLYAQWADASEGEQKKTGVISYVISFIAIGIIAGTIYLISRKKNLFKQIDL